MSHPEGLSSHIGTRLIDNMVLTENLKQEAVLTTRDKIKVALHEMLPRYAAKDHLAAPLGLFTGLLVAVFTADFRDTAGIPGEAFAGGFWLATAAAACWSAFELRRWFNRATLDDVADRIIEDATVKKVS